MHDLRLTRGYSQQGAKIDEILGHPRIRETSPILPLMSTRRPEQAMLGAGAFSHPRPKPTIDLLLVGVQAGPTQVLAHQPKSPQPFKR